MGAISCPSCGAELALLDVAATLVHCPGCSANLVPPGATALSMVLPRDSSTGDSSAGLSLQVQQSIALSAEMLERYRFERLLGSGAMGVVYKAHDTFRDVPVAVKVLNLKGEANTARFRREGRVMGQLTHPNIVRVYDTLEVDGHPCLICEFVAGGPLSDRIKQGPMMVAEAGRLTREVLAGLAACHALQILHRDIKPANVLLEGGKVAKLADFGLARVGEIGEEDGTLTRAGDRIGTPRYMAPEQFEKGGASIATDLYSVGVMLYEMVSSNTPYPGRNLAELYQQKRDGLPRLDAVMSGVRRVFADMVANATDVDPGKRPRTAEEFAEQIAAALRGGTTMRVRDRSGGIALPAQEPADPRPQSNITTGPNPAQGARTSGRIPVPPRGAPPVTLKSIRVDDGRRRAMLITASALSVILFAALAAAFLVRRPATVVTIEPSPTPSATAGTEPVVPADDARFLGLPIFRARSLERSIYVSLRSAVRAPVEVVVTDVKANEVRFRAMSNRDFVKRVVADGLRPETQYRVDVRSASSEWRVQVEPIEVRTLTAGYRDSMFRDQATQEATGLQENPDADFRLLARVGEDADISRVTDVMKEGITPGRWAAAADALGTIGNRISVHKLSWALRNTRKLSCEPWVDFALLALGEIGGDEAVAALEEFVKNGCAAEDASSHPLAPPSGPDDLNAGRRRRYLAAQQLALTDPDRAAKVFDTLRQLPARTALALFGAAYLSVSPWRDAAAIKDLEQPAGNDINGSNGGARVAALRGLPDMRRVAKALERTWSLLTNIRLRVALATFGDSASIAPLIADFKRLPWQTTGAEESWNWMLASLDLSAIAQLGARAANLADRKTAAQALADALDTAALKRHPGLRRQALRGLAWLAERSTAQAVEASFARDPSPRAEHAMALARCGSARAGEVVDTLLESQRGTELWAAAVASAALPVDQREPRWRRLKERVASVTRVVVRQELQEGMAWLAAGALSRPLLWIDPTRCLVPGGITLKKGQRFRLVAHGLTATRGIPDNLSSLPDHEATPERISDLNPPGGRLNSGVREKPVGGLSISIGSHYIEPHPSGYPWMTAQDDGVPCTHLRVPDTQDIHSAQGGEVDLVVRPALFAGMVLAEFQVER